MNWQMVIAIRAVYGVGVKLPAQSYEAPHNKKLWGYPYAEYPIANTYELDPMADSHNYQSSVWRHTATKHPIAKSYGVIRLSRTPWIANTYKLDNMADSHSYQSSVWSCSEPYDTQIRSTPQQKAMGLSLRRVPHSKHL